MTDPLTERRQDHYAAFLASFQDCMARAVESSGALSLAVVDIDLFGKVNAKHGRSAGDAAVAVVQRHLEETLAPKGEVMRYGGDAFAVVFEGVEKEDAFLQTEVARASFDRTHVVRWGEGQVELALALSVGLASFPDDGTDETGVIRKANEALYRAKVGGRNRVCLAREERMVTKTSHYAQGQLYGLSRLAKREGLGEARLLREALDDLLRKYNS